MTGHLAEAPWRGLQHYGQNIATGDFQLYDYWSEEGNIQHYGQATPPILDLKTYRNSGVPLALFPAAADLLGDVEDARWTRDQVLDGGKGKHALVHYQEVTGGHARFLEGRDMSYLINFLKVIRKYNPVHNSALSASAEDKAITAHYQKLKRELDLLSK